MRQDVHIDQVQIPWSTKLALGGLIAIVGGLVTWNLVETIALGKSQASENKAVWIEIGRIQATDQVMDVRLRQLESRAEREQK